jgi:hypothetical protein
VKREVENVVARKRAVHVLAVDLVLGQAGSWESFGKEGEECQLANIF